MRYQGKITKWNDGKGFGFIIRNDNNQQVFVHISAFGNTQQRSRPTVGEDVSFEVADDIKKGLQAYNVIYLNRQSSAVTPKASTRTTAAHGSVIGLGALVKVFGVFLIGVLLYKNIDILNPGDTHEAFDIADTHVEPVESMDTDNQVFKCSGKTHCSQMSSCAEAKYYLNHCPGTIADGDGDGIPCEDQWCGH